jgi:hypothetical protein
MPIDIHVVCVSIKAVYSSILTKKLVQKSCKKADFAKACRAFDLLLKLFFEARIEALTI